VLINPILRTITRYFCHAYHPTRDNTLVNYSKHEIIKIIFQNQIFIFVSITKTISWRHLRREMPFILRFVRNKPRGKNADILNFKECGTFSNHCTLNGSFNSLSRGWSPAGSTRHGGHWLAYCTCPGDYDDGEFGGMNIGRGNRSTRRKPAPAPLCPPQIPLDQTRDGPPAAAVGSQRLHLQAI
jgi:hypothetical protein